MIVIDSTKWLFFFVPISIKKDSGPRKYPNFYKNEVILKNQSCHQSTFVLKSPPFLSVYPIVEM